MAAFVDAARHTSFESRTEVSLGDGVQAETDNLVATRYRLCGQLLHLVCFASS